MNWYLSKIIFRIICGEGRHTPQFDEHLRLIAGELQMADVRTNVALSLFTDFENFAELAPGPHQAQALDTLLGEVVRWSEALAPLRQGVGAAQPG